MNEGRTYRQRHQTNTDDLDRLAEGPLGGGRAFVGLTVSNGSYPTSVGVFYAVQEQGVDGPEVEGSTPTFNPKGTVLALHVGATAPPVGSYVIVEEVPNRNVFQYG